MKIDVKKVARLANLPLTPGEEKRYSEQLSKILDYVEQLKRVQTSEVEPTFNVGEEKSVMRKDETQAGLSQEDVLQNAQNQENGFFVTKGILKEE